MHPIRTTCRNRIFSVPLARVFLAMSAIVYERKDALVNEAADIIYQASKKYTKGSHQYDVEVQKAQAKLVQSEQTIKTWAAKMGLAFDGVSDLSSNSSAFASLFATPVGSSQKPFIVLCFKGESLLPRLLCNVVKLIRLFPSQNNRHDTDRLRRMARRRFDLQDWRVGLVRTGIGRCARRLLHRSLR